MSDEFEWRVQINGVLYETELFESRRAAEKFVESFNYTRAKSEPRVRAVYWRRLVGKWEVEPS